MSGAILTSGLHSLHAETAAGAGGGVRALVEQGLQQIAQLPASQRELVIAAYRHAISTTFLVGSAIIAMAFALVLFLPEHQLKSSR